MTYEVLRRRAATIGIGGALLIAGVGAGPANAGGDKDCSDFKTHKQAQKWFNKHGGSKKNNVDDLDADHDGKACEDLP